MNTNKETACCVACEEKTKDGIKFCDRPDCKCHKETPNEHVPDRSSKTGENEHWKYTLNRLLKNVENDHIGSFLAVEWFVTTFEEKIRREERERAVEIVKDIPLLPVIEQIRSSEIRMDEMLYTQRRIGFKIAIDTIIETLSN